MTGDYLACIILASQSKLVSSIQYCGITHYTESKFNRLVIVRFSWELCAVAEHCSSYVTARLEIV